MTARRERRRHIRSLLDLPLEYRVVSAPYAHGAVVINASEGGLLIESIKDIPVKTRLVVAVLFPSAFQLASFEVVTEIIWKAGPFLGDRKKWQYGLRFVKMMSEEHQKLKQLLESEICPDEIFSSL